MCMLGSDAGVRYPLSFSGTKSAVSFVPHFSIHPHMPAQIASPVTSLYSLTAEYSYIGSVF